MDKTDNYQLNVNSNAAWRIEEYIEGLFRQWTINEIYLANIVTSFSNLINLLLALSEKEAVSITSCLKNEIISFTFSGIEPSVLKLFLKEHHLQDIQDNFAKSVFLIQKIADEIAMEDEKLILKFNTGALPEAYLDNRIKSLKNYYRDALQKTIND